MAMATVWRKKYPPTPSSPHPPHPILLPPPPPPPPPPKKKNHGHHTNSLYQWLSARLWYRNSSTLVMGLPQSCAKSSIFRNFTCKYQRSQTWCYHYWKYTQTSHKHFNRFLEKMVDHMPVHRLHHRRSPQGHEGELTVNYLTVSWLQMLMACSRWCSQ